MNVTRIRAAVDGDARPTLAALDGGGQARQDLDELLGLPDIGLHVTEAAIYGSGSGARVEVGLSNGSRLEWDTLRDATARPAFLAELVAATGSVPKLGATQVLEAVGLIHRIARHTAALTQRDAAVEWGVSYLQATVRHQVDMADAADRWRAFQTLTSVNPHEEAREGVVAFARCTTTLADTDGTRYVRSGWFASHVRTLEPLSPSAVAARMLAAGWTRPGSRGRVNARDPHDRDAQLSWNFLLVPAGWEETVGADDPETVVTRGGLTPHAHRRTRVEGTTTCNRTTTATGSSTTDDDWTAGLDPAEAPEEEAER